MDSVAGPQRRHVGLNLSDHPQEVRDVESDVFGFWVFFMSAAVLFALLFAVYGTMPAATVGAPGPLQMFKIGAAFIETLLLLTSSFPFGLASIALKRDVRAARLVLWLVVTPALGIAFLAMEGQDFATMAADHGAHDRSRFLSAFFVLVGMHGLHVTIDAIWTIVMLVQLSIFGRDRSVKLNLIRLSLFWHFLDIVWIAIFSVVYLQGLIQ